MTNADRPQDLPRLLLLSRTPPGNSNVGQLYLRDLCESYPADKLAFGVVQPQYLDADLRAFPEVPKLYLSRNNAPVFDHGPKLLATLLSHLAFRHHAIRGDREVVEEFVRFGREHRVEKVWAVLNSPTLYRIAPRVAARLDVPLVTMVWDPPSGVGLHFGLDRLSRAHIRKHFATALAASERCGVVSERMEREYRATYGIKSVVLRRGIATSAVDQSKQRDDSEVRIGFCGNLYAKQEWQAFLDALDEIEWRLGDKPIRLIIAAFWIPFLGARGPARVDYLGWRDLAETVEVMARCHFAYFPYWLDPAYAEPARLCFADKLTTYLTAALPILYHGPSDAGVVDFFSRFPAAELCHSHETAVIAASLRRLADGERRQRMSAAARQAVAQELNPTVFRERFRQLVGTSRA